MPPRIVSLPLVVAALAAGALPACASSTEPTPAPWEKTYGNSADQVAIVAAVDPTGQLALTGSFNGGIDFGGRLLKGTGFDDADAFFARLDDTGKARWSGATGSRGEQLGRGMAFDLQGNTIAAGHFNNTVSFGRGTLTALSQDTFVAKFDADGKTLWAKHFGADDGGPTGVGDSDPLAGVAVDHDDNIVMAGYFSGTLGFGGPPLEAPLAQTFVVKLGPKGEHIFTRGFGDGPNQPYALGVDTDGSILVAGTNFGSLRFGGQEFAAGPGAERAFVARLGPTGQPVWLGQFGGQGISDAFGLAIDPAGDLLVVGKFSGSLEIGGLALHGQAGSGGFVAKLSAVGEPLWLKGFHGGQGVAKAVATDAAGNVFFTGSYSGAPSFGGTPLPLRNLDGAFLAKLDLAGQSVTNWAFSPPDHTSAGLSVAVDRGDVVVAGSFDGRIQLNQVWKTSAGMNDLFLARIRP